MQQLYRIEEAAKILALSPKTLRKWIYERKINYVKVGGAVRISVSELERIMEGGERERIAL